MFYRIYCGERVRVGSFYFRCAAWRLVSASLLCCCYSPALMSRLYQDANSVSATLDVGNVMRRSRLLIYGGAALASLLIFTGVLKWGPKENTEGGAQLVTPTTLAASPKAFS